MFWFKASDGTVLYMGKDKFENEDLIRWGWPEDVWFHVDGLSSAHVYARILTPGSAAAKTCTVYSSEEGAAGGGGGGNGWGSEPGGSGAQPVIPPPVTLDSISEAALKECAQLVKANSIEGCKKSTVTVVITLWSNLKKDGSMAPGQVGFHSDRAVRRVTVGERDKELLSSLAKTRLESQPDLEKVRAAPPPPLPPPPPARAALHSQHKTRTHYTALRTCRKGVAGMPRSATCKRRSQRPSQPRSARQRSK
jgi:hypothetical protein